MKKNIEITGNTYRTSDYSIFKRLEGNRNIKSLRVSKIEKSIEKSGYIYNPIYELYQRSNIEKFSWYPKKWIKED